ncbi:hypothetical protein BDQ17DRAFT_1419875 [Cyathus striatus]|nr:hypothetical protein BDQ17DRAFT_1419875 [Cyathus striatus]
MPPLRYYSPPPFIKDEYDETISFSKYDIDTNLATLQICNGDLHDWGITDAPCQCAMPKNTVKSDIEEGTKLDPESMYRVRRRSQIQHTEPSYWPTENHDSDLDWPNSDEEVPGLPDRLEEICGLYIHEHFDVTDEEDDSPTAKPLACGSRPRRAALVTRDEKFHSFHETTNRLANITGRSVAEAFDAYFRHAADPLRHEHSDYSPSGSDISLPDSDCSEGSPSSPDISVLPTQSIIEEEADSEDLLHVQMYHEVLEPLQASKVNIPTDSILLSETPLGQEQPAVCTVAMIQSVVQDSANIKDSDCAQVIGHIETPSSGLPACPVSQDESAIRNEKTLKQSNSEGQSKAGAKRQRPRLKERRGIIMTSPRNAFLLPSPSESDAGEQKDDDYHQVIGRGKPARRRKSPIDSVSRLQDGDEECTDDSSNLTRSRGKKSTSNNKKVYKCELCPKIFTRRNDVKRHMGNASIHKGAIPSDMNSDTRCRRCGEELSRLDARVRHEARNACFKRTIPRPAGYIRAPTDAFLVTRM